MRSTLLIGCLLWVAVCVHTLTRIERTSSIHKRSPQVYQPPPNSTYGGYAANNQSQQFQWVKVNNQWVRRDGTKLPGYSQANVPYNQTGNQWNTPTPSRQPVPNQPSGVSSWNNTPRPGNQSAPGVGWGQQPRPQTPQSPGQQRPQQTPQSPPRRQNSTTSQSGLGWNPDADRALTQDLPPTTPRPVYTTSPVPVLPQTPPPAYRPPAATPPIQAPFGSGVGGGQQRPSGSRGTWNPDASLTYGTGGRNPPPQGTRTPVNPNPSRGSSNPWANL